MSKSVSLKMLGLKLVKLDCISILLDSDTIKKLEMSWMEPAACLLFIFIFSYTMIQLDSHLQ